jgi:aminoglycoside phosphotransferase (APT) family kinase protein
MTISIGQVSSGGPTVREKRDDLPLGRLESWMRDHVGGSRGPLAAERFEGGQSNPTYKLLAGTGEYVLRRKPLGHLLPSAHAVDREYRVMRALAGTAVPVPRIYALCEDDAIIGSTFSRAPEPLEPDGDVIDIVQRRNHRVHRFIGHNA